MARGSGICGSRWLLLSDGALPTEDIYFMATAAPWLRYAGATVTRLDTRRWASPLLCWPWLDRTLAGAQIIVCRSLSEAWIDLLETRRAQVASVHYLLDDDLDAAARDPGLPTGYRERMGWVSRRILPRLLALADEVVVPNEELAARIRPRHSRVVTLAPALLFSPEMATPEATSTGWRLGYHGTRAHRRDLEQISSALVSVLEAHSGLMLEVAMGRYTPQSLRQHDRVGALAPMAWHTYLRHLKGSRLHLGLAPLWPTTFNTAKSHIKFLEIAAMGGVGLFSRRAPYSNIVSDGEDGLLVDDDPADWQRCLVRLLESPRETHRMAQRALEKARDIGSAAHHHAFWGERQC
ncbi:glycosyltransferase [Halomonas sp. H33-56]|uniref:glycosyltransferase family protein n=1 Tax=Halomonas sp. H33-56 TaxID=2950873 RepID=UPI0032DF153D